MSQTVFAFAIGVSCAAIGVTLYFRRKLPSFKNAKTNQYDVSIESKNLIISLSEEIARTRQENEELTDKLLKAKEVCDISAEALQKERLGRISVQKRARDRLSHENLKSGYQYRPIGFIESPFPDRRGTPRQPVLVPAAKGKIRFDKSLIQNEHFKEIDQFSHIWVIFVFHENTNTDSESLPARIKPPRLGKKVGCLSTRSPHRPNNIGLSVCEVVEVGLDFIGISGIDFVDGTPVLDIKPYIPYDSITHSIPLPMSVEASSSLCMQSDGSMYEARRLSVPTWIVDSDIPIHPVSFDECALEAIEELVLDRMLNHCSTTHQAIDLIRQVLRQDIRGVHQGRGQVSSASHHINFEINGTRTKGAEIQIGDEINNQKGDLTFLQSHLSEQLQSEEYMCRLDCMLLKFITSAIEIRVTSIEYYHAR